MAGKASLESLWQAVADLGLSTERCALGKFLFLPKIFLAKSMADQRSAMLFYLAFKLWFCKKPGIQKLCTAAGYGNKMPAYEKQPKLF
jgi:hypothetical protein